MAQNGNTEQKERKPAFFRDGIVTVWTIDFPTYVSNFVLAVVDFTVTPNAAPGKNPRHYNYRGARVMNGDKGFYVSPPAFKKEDEKGGTVWSNYYDIPLDFREEVQRVILLAYDKWADEMNAAAASAEEQTPQGAPTPPATGFNANDAADFDDPFAE